MGQGVGTNGPSIFGVTSQGGANNLGTVFSLTKSINGWSFQVLHSFSGNDGENPYGTLLNLSGELIGTTSVGGPGGGGTLFQLSEQNGVWHEQILFNFSNVKGAKPLSGVVAAPNGVLYGLTETGGIAGVEGGVAYQITP
jgi:uncharacterized repeat protein (TIGR03803 family)